MPFKRKNSPYWQIRKYNLPGYGDSGAISTKSKSKSVAARMEALLEDIANKAVVDATWHPLLDAICNHEITLLKVLKENNRGALERLRMSLVDPPISDAIKALRLNQSVSPNVNLGLKKIDEFAGKEMMSTLTTSRVIALIHQYMDAYGVLQNTAVQKIKMGVSALLTFHYGMTEKDAIMRGVKFKHQDDTREVHISSRDITKLLQACHDAGREEIAVLVQVALITSADRGVLLRGKEQGRTYRGLLKKDIDIVQDTETGMLEGTVILRDGKTANRTRTVRLPHSLCQSLMIMCADKGPNDPVFKIKYQSFRDPWAKVRKAAGLWDEENGYAFRFKDLRAQTAIYAERLGIEQSKIQRTLGHSNESMTRRYQRTKAAMSQNEIENLSVSLFGSYTNKSTNTG